MSQIFRFFIVNWKFSAVTTVFVVMIGILSLSLLQRETFPPVNFAVVGVNTIYPGASPDEVYDRVTLIIEEELRGIEGIKDVRSVSQNESSEISIRIDIDGVDSKEVVTDIQKAVQRASSRLPAEVLEAPRVLEVNAKEIPVLELAILGTNTDRARDRLADRLKESMENNKGVASVRLSGYQEREIQILLDQKKLAQFGLGLTDVFFALNQQVKNVPTGYVDDRSRIALVRVFGKNISQKALEDLIVRSNDAGSIVRVRDVAKVVDGAKRPKVIARIDGEEATILVTTKKADADALKTLSEVMESVAAFEKTLPTGFRLINYNDEGKRIQNRLDIVSFNALTGMLIVLIVLFAFLPGKVGLFSSLSLPICALATVALMVYFGANFNIITMVALIICLGNLVDNSVVISEYYTDLRERGIEATEAAVQSAVQFWIPFTASTITIISAFIPMLVTQGVMGQFIKWIPIIVAIALSLSLLEALTLLPARLQFLNPKPKKSGSGHWFAAVEKRFAAILRWSVYHKYITLFSLILLTFSSCGITAVFNRFELFPAEGVEYYVGRFSAPPQTSLFRTDELGAGLAKKVIDVLGKDVVSSVAGRAGIQQTDPADPRTKVGENVGLLLIGIKPEVAPNLNITETLQKLRAIPKPEGLELMTFEPIENGPPIGKPLTMTFRSSNEIQLRTLSDRMIEALKDTPGISNLEDDELDTGIEYQFTAEDRLRSYASLTNEQIGINLRTALEGNAATKLTEAGKEFELVVRFAEDYRKDINSLKSLEILTPRGTMVPLSSIGEFKSVGAPRAKKNFDFKRAITITADVDNINLTSQSVSALALEKFKALSKDFPEVSYVFGGEEENTKDSLRSLMIALLLAIFGIFATLVFTFRSFSLPLLILSSIPLGLVGVFYSFTIIQRPLSFLAFIGVVGLSGVVINSAIILVDYIKELSESGSEMTIEEMLIYATSRRLRAVIATGLTTVVGLLPAAFGWGGYDAILVDITLALSWGMIIGTVLSLFWIPSGYLVLLSIKKPIEAKLKKWIAVS